jgi:hypothetical protein
VAIDLAMALDSGEILRAAGIEPDPWQSEYLECEDPQIEVLCARQTGKSTASAAKVLRKAYRKPGSLSLVLSPTQRQSGEVMAKVRHLYNAAPLVPLDKENELEWRFVTGSRIVCLPGVEGTVRGYSAVDLMILDEASRIPDALAAAVGPMLAVSRGQVVDLTTPFGKRGYFHAEWSRGLPEGWDTAYRIILLVATSWGRSGIIKPADVKLDERWQEKHREVAAAVLPVITPGRSVWANWERALEALGGITSTVRRFLVTAADCPRIAQSFLEGELQRYGAWWFLQEFFCLFQEAIDQVFGYDVVMDMLGGGVMPLAPERVREPGVEEIVSGGVLGLRL